MRMRLQTRGSNERKLRELLKTAKIRGGYISDIKQDTQFLSIPFHYQMISATTRSSTPTLYQ
jgi:hypothetical protein